MPHDLKGLLIEAGDIIKAKVFHDAVPNGVVVGHVLNVTPSDTCTGQVLFHVLGGALTAYFNAKDSELVLKKDGTEPAVPEAPAAAAPAEPAPQ